eukprot:261057-Pelagomonas_calceolata.AAC.1
MQAGWCPVQTSTLCKETVSCRHAACKSWCSTQRHKRRSPRSCSKLAWFNVKSVATKTAWLIRLCAYLFSKPSTAE